MSETETVSLREIWSVTTVTPQLFVAIVRVMLTLHVAGVQAEDEALAGEGRDTSTIATSRKAKARALIGQNH